MLIHVPPSLENFELLGEERAAAMMDCGLEQVEKLRKAGAIIGIPDHEGDFVYPEWQFRYDGQPYSEIEQVVGTLPDTATVYEFMTTAHASTANVTGAEWLRLTREDTLAEKALEWLASRDK